VRKIKRRECSGFAKVNKVTSASLGFPQSVFNKNSTLKLYPQLYSRTPPPEGNSLRGSQIKNQEEEDLPCRTTPKIDEETFGVLGKHPNNPHILGIPTISIPGGGFLTIKLSKKKKHVKLSKKPCPRDTHYSYSIKTLLSKVCDKDFSEKNKFLPGVSSRKKERKKERNLPGTFFEIPRRSVSVANCGPLMGQGIETSAYFGTALLSDGSFMSRKQQKSSQSTLQERKI